MKPMPVLFKAFSHIAPKPSEAQLEAGNYPKQRLAFQGLPVTIENPRGSIRSGRSKGGREWSVSMQHHYGYIRGTRGSDGDHYDVYVGPDAAATHAYIVTTMCPPDFTRVDEQKAMLGFGTEEEARAAYLVHYDDPRFCGPIQAMPMDEFKLKVRATSEGGSGLVKAMPPILFLKATIRGGAAAKAPPELAPHTHQRPVLFPAPGRPS